jgi:tetratricopeptide (TPR) repeat protein
LSFLDLLTDGLRIQVPAAALELYETAAAGYAAAGDAANAAEARKNGGIALQRQGKHAEARPRLEAAVAALTELLGPAHVRTLRARQALGNGMLNQGELGAARVELEAAAAGLEAALGSAHTSTLAVRDSLAILLERAGDHAAAAAARSARAYYSTAHVCDTCTFIPCSDTTRNKSTCTCCCTQYYTHCRTSAPFWNADAMPRARRSIGMLKNRIGQKISRCIPTGGF